MNQRAPIFDQIIVDYLERVAAIDDRPRRADLLGVDVSDDGLKVPFFNTTITISNGAIVDQAGAAPSHSASVTACQYLLLCPDRPPSDAALCTYKDFSHAAPYVGGFRNTAEQPIARSFAGRVERLQAACRDLDGQPFDTDVTCELAAQFQALPRVPLYLVFHDADEEFPAQCTLLFRRDAAEYLDMECLAMIGSTLAHRLVTCGDTRT